MTLAVVQSPTEAQNFFGSLISLGEPTVTFVGQCDLPAQNA